MIFIKHSNVSIFVPHNGCPHMCTFCNQREITGQVYQPDKNDVVNAAEIAKKSLKDKTNNAEIAFFGGSFTAIDRNYMIELLSAAAPYVRSGDFYGIRISTRPDAINDEILNTLKDYNVTSIELGAQSMNDEVLRLNRRGHTAEDVIKSSKLIHKYGFSLGLQMMTGLYSSSDERDIQTAHALSELSPDTMRIYPTTVLYGTELYELYNNGKYIPPTLENAVNLCAYLLEYFEKKNISVIRLGLHDSESLRENMAAGIFHPAFRELCESRIMYQNTISQLNKFNFENKNFVFTINPKSLSKFVGQKRSNITKLEETGIKLRIDYDSSLGKYEVKVRNEKL